MSVPQSSCHSKWGGGGGAEEMERVKWGSRERKEMRGGECMKGSGSGVAGSEER